MIPHVNCAGDVCPVAEDLASPEGLTGYTLGTAQTFRLCDVHQAAEDLAHARLQGKVFGTSGNRNDQVGRFQVPVLGQQLIEGFGVRVTGESDVLRGRGTASWLARDLLTVPA